MAFCEIKHENINKNKVCYQKLFFNVIKVHLDILNKDID